MFESGGNSGDQSRGARFPTLACRGALAQFRTMFGNSYVRLRAMTIGCILATCPALGVCFRWIFLPEMSKV
jgi:hypothetical protein